MTVWEFVKYSFLLLLESIVVVSICFYFGLEQEYAIIVGIATGVISVEFIFYKNGM